MYLFTQILIKFTKENIFYFLLISMLFENFEEFLFNILYFSLGIKKKIFSNVVYTFVTPFEHASRSLELHHIKPLANAM